MRRMGRLAATETESDLVVAIFRTAFIIIVTFSPTFLPESRSASSLQITLALAGLYNLGLLVAYWRGIRFPYQRHLTIAIDLLLTTLWIYYSGPLGVRFFPLYYITVIVAGFWFGVAGTLVSAAIAGLLYVAVVSSLSPQAQAQNFVADALYERIPFLFLVSLVVSYIAYAQAKERQVWYEARLFLARHQERIRLGQKIYDLLTPGAMPVLPRLDLGARFRPPSHAGAGDYYEVIKFTDNCVGVALADVAGKLEPGLVKLPLFKAALRVSAQVDGTPSRLLTEVNQLLYPDLQPEMFISLSYCLFDTQAMQLHCAVAGHEPPILITSAGKHAEEIQASGMVLGVMPDTVYEQQTLPLAPGDTIILFTDGVTEAQNQMGEEFGAERLREAAKAADARDLSAQGLADRLMELVLNFSAPTGRRDDMTILVTKVLPEE